MLFPEYDLFAAVENWVHSLEGTLTAAASPFWWPSLVLAGLAGIVIAKLAGVRFVEVHRAITPTSAAPICGNCRSTSPAGWRARRCPSCSDPSS